MGLASLLLSHASKSQSSWSKFRPPTTPLVVSTVASLNVVVLFNLKSQSPVPHLSCLRPSCQSLSPSVSPRLSVLLPQVVPSHNACSIIGRSSVAILSKPAPKVERLSKQPESARVSSPRSQASTTSSTSSEQP